MLQNKLPPGAVASSPPASLRTPIAVIGSGPGGAITAALLAEGGREVLLLEEGPYLPLDSCIPFTRQEMEQKYRNGGLTAALGQCKIGYVEGRCAGGGSEINSGLYHRTPADVLEQWRRTYWIEGFSEAELIPHFSACERDLSVSYLPGAAPAASLKLHHGAQRLGWQSLEVPRWFTYTATGANAAGGIKQSMTQTFIPRALAAGATLLPDTRIIRLNRIRTGWRLWAEHSPLGDRQHRLTIDATTIFVAGGAIQTPVLLRRSGIKANVGNSLRFHPTVKVVACFPEAVNSVDMGVPVHQVKQFAPRFSFGCAISTSPYLALTLVDHPHDLAKVHSQWRHMAVYYAMIGGGQGIVRPVPWCRDPLIRYRLRATDLYDLSDALHELCRVLLAAGAEAIYPSISGHPVIHGETDLTRIPRPLPPTRTSLMTVHLMASCPMGENRHLAAVDSFGKVHELEDLYIADASLLGGAAGVNPQGTVMALARRNALRFLDKL